MALSTRFLKNRNSFGLLSRMYFIKKLSSQSERSGLVLGIYSTHNENENIKLTPATESYNNSIQGKLVEKIKLGNQIKPGEARIFWGLDNKYQSVAVVGLKDLVSPFNELEYLNEKYESIRIAAAAGCTSLASVGIDHITVENLGDSEAAAEGAVLSTWIYQEHKEISKKTKIPKISPYEKQFNKEFNSGVVKANAQNLARYLMETPGNFMTPNIFAEKILQELNDSRIKIDIRDRAWIEKEKMGAFLSVTKGSVVPPIFLEITYNGNDDNHNPFVLIGKGITFDSGGISIKSSLNMDHMRADMGGGACVVGTIKALAELKIPVNIKGLIPLCENMPSGNATKPGDVIVAKNGKTICVDNTDAEGRLILADSLCYSKKFNPSWILDIATLTGAMAVALGKGATGVFTNSPKLWDELEQAGAITGDRVWRFPLWKCYSDLITKYNAYDLNNIGKGKGGGSCTAAAFLNEFVPKSTNWLHLDIAGVMGPDDTIPYLKKGMTGRPTRTLIQFIEQLSKK